ncbi:hypothetical protein Y032_0142g2299 [Ancylostoma ceylanicum]|uniref:Uncharacterized protein n=1 Tax=Ancylostoma ceylanicum TaxID=53326 RepID=A0A016T2J9_9BILA|nr:hypothetical protein Y032_0142g2299 [Ancylostoma ceylanicum]
MSYENEVYLDLRVAIVERHKVRRTLPKFRIHDDEITRVSVFQNVLAIAVPSPIPKAPMASVSIFRRSYMTVQVSRDNYCIFHRYFRCLFGQQHPEVIFHLFTTACLWGVCREEVKTLFCGGDDDLHETVIDALHLSYRVPEALRDDYAHTISGLWAAAVDYLKAVSHVL